MFRLVLVAKISLEDVWLIYKPGICRICSTKLISELKYWLGRLQCNIATGRDIQSILLEAIMYIGCDVDS
jgi:hypothetical protein